MIGVAVGEQDALERHRRFGDQTQYLCLVAAGIDDETGTQLLVIDEVAIGLQWSGGYGNEPGAYFKSP